MRLQKKNNQPNSGTLFRLKNSSQDKQDVSEITVEASLCSKIWVYFHTFPDWFMG